MKLTALEAIATSLATHNVEYIVVDGVAVVAHGYVRYTGDIDLVIGKVRCGSTRRACRY